MDTLDSLATAVRVLVPPGQKIKRDAFCLVNRVPAKNVIIPNRLTMEKILRNMTRPARLGSLPQVVPLPMSH